jgi:asparaginyl-tRNA synthetase
VKRTKIKQIFTEALVDTEVWVQGWIRTRRESKTFAFLEVNDGSTIKNLQIIADQQLPGYADWIKELSTGSCVGIKGKLVPSQGKGQSVEMQAQQVEVYGTADAETYPLQKKGHTLEFLREIAHLRARTNTFGAVYRLRNAMAFGVHQYFQDQGFLYLHTPILTGSDTEGAGEMFAVTTLPLQQIPKNDTGEIDFTQDFFGKPTHLTVSGQLNGETAALALSDIYTFGPTFRAENSNTTRHLAEFWMIEPEMAFYDLTANMDLAEDFLRYLIRIALTQHRDDLDFLTKQYDPDLINRLEFVLNNPFIRITYTEAIDILISSAKSFEYPVSWGADLQSEHERFLVEEHFASPVIVTDYPKTIKAFYMRQNEDGKTVRAMDILFPGIGEIIGGSQREERYEVLLARIQEMGLSEQDYSWYLDTRRYGSAPHSGFGLGFERLLLFVTGMSNIRDVIPFPRTPGNADF